MVKGNRTVMFFFERQKKTHGNDASQITLNTHADNHNTPRTEKAWQTSSLAARRAGQMRAGRSKPTPFHLGEEGGNGRGAGRWYVSGCGR